MEEKEITSITMNCKPSSSKTISLLSRKQNKRHDKEMNEFKDKLIKNKLKQTASKKKSVRVEGKEKEKEEAVVKKALVKGKKTKAQRGNYLPIQKTRRSLLINNYLLQKSLKRQKINYIKLKKLLIINTDEERRRML